MIVGSMGPAGCGGTFLDWTLHFLSGSEKNWVVECDLRFQRSAIAREYSQTIITSPIENATAHKHLKTHPNHNSVQAVIESFDRQQFALNSFYYTNIVSTDSPTYTSIVESYPGIKFIAFDFSPDDINMIFCLQYEKVPMVADRFLQMIKQQHSKMSTWEQREILSISYPKIIQPQVVEKISTTSNVIHISFNEMLLGLDVKILEIFNFLKLSIDEQKWDHWNSVYRIWQQKNYVNFYKDLDKIIECIINNRSLNLDEYGMSFAKEAVIASVLLYHHNLALKMDGLEIMPSDTNGWHKLLERNVYHVL